jgi:hypothetical protein
MPSWRERRKKDQRLLLREDLPSRLTMRPTADLLQPGKPGFLIAPPPQADGSAVANAFVSVSRPRQQDFCRLNP